MDRRTWLTMIVREANLFLETYAPSTGKLTDAELDELEPELHSQLKEVFHRIDHLEDVIKHSLLKNPAPDLWYGENEWPHVLAAVASACLVHDVKGVISKISAGELERIASHKLMEPLEEMAPPKIVAPKPARKKKKR